MAYRTFGCRFLWLYRPGRVREMPGPGGTTVMGNLATAATGTSDRSPTASRVTILSKWRQGANCNFGLKSDGSLYAWGKILTQSWGLVTPPTKHLLR